jgi:hypothetical protein
MQAMEELGHVQLPGIVYRSLQQGAVHYHAETRGDEWHDNDLVAVSLRIQIPSDKMQLCSLSAYACPYQSKLETSVALCCVTLLHILEWHFIVPSTRCTCVMIMLLKQLLDNPST